MIHKTNDIYHAEGHNSTYLWTGTRKHKEGIVNSVETTSEFALIVDRYFANYVYNLINHRPRDRDFRANAVVTADTMTYHGVDGNFVDDIKWQLFLPYSTDEFIQAALKFLPEHPTDLTQPYLHDGDRFHDWGGATTISNPVGYREVSSYHLDANETYANMSRGRYRLLYYPPASDPDYPPIAIVNEAFTPDDDYSTPGVDESLNIQNIPRVFQVQPGQTQSEIREIDITPILPPQNPGPPATTPPAPIIAALNTNPTPIPPPAQGTQPLDPRAGLAGSVTLCAQGPIFELNSDLNNDGIINATDSALRTASVKPDSTDEAKDKGTEYLFVNDNISNGLWDKDDPLLPVDELGFPETDDDDDVQKIKTVCAATYGAIWFEHPIISKLAFYPNKQCNSDEKLAFPFVLSETNHLPEILYIRAEEVTVQVEGDLVMILGKADKTETWAEDKLKLTIVKELGDTKYFHATRDYILENNTELFVHRKGYPSDDPDTEFTVCAMREEATRMEPVETRYRGPNQSPLLGIGAVVSNRPDLTVVTNGNQVFFSDGWKPSFGLSDANHKISDKCHGRLIYSGVSSFASSDNTDSTTIPPGSELAGIEGNYIAQNHYGPFMFGMGRVPDGPSPWMGLGGLSTNYSDQTRANLPQTIVGYAPVLEGGKGIVFTASQPPLGGGNTGFPSGGRAPELAADAHRSGVPAMPGAPTGRYKLLILDSGRTSVALAHVNPSGTLRVQFSGAKHSGSPYYVNTYLGFKSTRPRPNQ